MMVRSKYSIALMSVLMAVLANPAMAQWTSPYGQWENGPSTDPNFFPIAVWAQMPMDSDTYYDMGVNIYIGLTGWRPIPDQINIIYSNNVQIIASQTSETLAAKDRTLPDGRPLIIGWRQEDEPDNHPLTPPSTIQNYYNTWTTVDPTRPIWLNLSQGLGNDGQTWVGQGGNINPSYHYPLYLAACDIASFDIYPMSCSRSTTCDDAWRPAFGVDGLFQYSDPGKIVWNCIETGDINANGQKATPEEIKMEVWSSIIHGSRGICYFIHGYSPDGDFDVNALLHPANSENRAAVEKINSEIHLLAPVINSEDIDNTTVVSSITRSNTAVPIDFMVKFHNGATYIFTASMREGGTSATVNLVGNYPQGFPVEVIGENRQLSISNNSITDQFDDYQAHIYKINTTVADVGVAGAYLFYNNCSFDGYDPVANANDDNAIAIDKLPLFSGQQASFLNYSSYYKGINGLIIDMKNPAGQLSPSDFEFTAGNNEFPQVWNAVSPMDMTVRPGEGVDGTDRVTFIWQDNTIYNKWLKITVKATENTGLGESQSFYFGNAIGDTGDQPGNAVVDATDQINCRNNPRHFSKPAGLDDPHDHNRDGKVDATDEIISRNFTSTVFNALEIISIP